MEDLFLRYLNLSIRGCWLILAIVFLRALFQRAPKRFRMLLWAILAFRLLCPWTFESALSFLPKGDAVPMDIALSRLPEIDTGVQVINHAVNPLILENFTPSPVNSANPLQVWIYIASIVWLSGIGAMVLYLIISSVLLKNRMREAVLLYDNIFESERTDSAFVFGIIRPKIYLPVHLDEAEKKYIISHEKTHIRHGDHLLRPLGFLIKAVHWYNPLVWLADRLFTQDIELSCDETVLGTLNEKEHAEYASILLKNAAASHIAACPVAFGETGVKTRIKKILDYRKPSFWAGLILIVCAVTTAGCFLSDPKKTDPSPTVTPEPETSAEPEVTPSPAVKTLEMEAWGQGADHEVHYRTSDPAFTGRFDELLSELISASEEGEIVLKENEEYDNIMDYFLSSQSGAIGFQEGNFPYGQQMLENTVYVTGQVLQNGTVTARKAVLIPAESEMAEKLKTFVNDIVNAAGSQVFDPARDPESVKAALNRLGDPQEYTFPFCGHFDMTNMEVWDEFVNLVNSGIPCSTEIGNYTVEGDIIYSYLQYDGNDFFFAMDTSRDKFGGSEDFWYTTKKYLSYVQDLYTDEADGRQFDTYTAVLSDEQYGTYDEIRQAQLEEDQIVWVWGFQKVHEN